MENQNSVKCRYCRYVFKPEPVITKNGKRRRAYIECPRCGNGIERPARWYDFRKVVTSHG